MGQETTTCRQTSLLVLSQDNPGDFTHCVCVCVCVCVCAFCRYPTSISSLSFSTDGSVLAVASSYQFEDGELANIPEDSIFVRKVTDQETKPK